MSSIESIDEILLNHQPALPSSRLSLLEQAMTRIFLGLAVLLLLGLVFQNEMVWDDGLRPIIWEPVEADAGEQGDEGYTPENTAIYTFGLLASVVVFQALFRTLNLHLGADVLTVHAEACTHLHRTLGAIRAAGMKAGVALNPHTPVESIRDVANDLDLVCLMSVNPGFGGKSFIERTYAKTRALRAMLLEEGSVEAHIEIDGGVGLGNAKALVEAGADVLVAGSSVFRAPDPMQAALDLATL